MSKRTMMGKPVINIREAWIDSSLGAGYRFLWGIPEDHPNESLNGTKVHTSYVVKVEGNLVETKTSMYNVLSWDENRIHPQAELF